MSIVLSLSTEFCPQKKKKKRGHGSPCKQVKGLQELLWKWLQFLSLMSLMLLPSILYLAWIVLQHFAVSTRFDSSSMARIFFSGSTYFYFAAKKKMWTPDQSPWQCNASTWMCVNLYLSSFLQGLYMYRYIYILACLLKLYNTLNPTKKKKLFYETSFFVCFISECCW